MDHELPQALLDWSDGLSAPLRAARTAIPLLGWRAFVRRFERAPDEVLALVPEGRAFAAEVDKALADFPEAALRALEWAVCCVGGFVLAETDIELSAWQALVDRGWLRDRDGRHHVPEPWRILLRHRLAATLGEAEHDHAAHYLGCSEEADATWRRRERDNLEAIISRFREKDPALSVAAALALAPVLRFDLPADELRQRLLDTLEAAERATALSASVRAELANQMVDHGAFDDALRWLEPAAETPEVEARLAVYRGHIHVWREDYGRAVEAFDAAEAAFEHASSPSPVKLNLALQRGFLALERGDADAQARLEAATREAERRGHARGVTIGLHLTGRLHLREGRPEAAVRFLCRARARHVEEGDPRSICFNDAWLARAHRAAGAREAALEAARRAHAFAAGDVSDALELLSLVELAALGQWPDPERMREMALTVGVPRVRREAEAWLSVRDRPPLGLSEDGGRAYFEGELIDLRRHGAPRRVLGHLAAVALRDPMATVDVDELFAAGWPDENISLRSRTKRVHTAIWTLRRLGLGDVLHTKEGGYRLAARVRPTTFEML